MKTYDLIFSHKVSSRILRHAIFWIATLIYYQYTFVIPNNYFPGWYIHKGVAAFDQLGPSKFAVYLLVNSLRYISFQILCTYIILYIFLPRLLLKGKNLAFVLYTLLLIAVILILWILTVYYSTDSICKIFGVKGKTVTFKFLWNCGIDNVFFFLPTITVIAISIKLLKHWYQKNKESQELFTSKAKAELQLLKAQVHPHFLFNTLNNIYSFILTSSPKAPELLKKLSWLLHYIVHDCSHALVPLEKELKMINDYIALETVRYGEQFDISVDIRGDYQHIKIAPLILLPFVENCFKHGSSKTLLTPWVNLDITVEDDILFFMLNNSRPEEYVSPAQNGGLGLSNVQKRLQLLYPGNHELTITSEPQRFTVLLEIDLEPTNAKTGKRSLKKEKLAYEFA